MTGLANKFSFFSVVEERIRRKGGHGYSMVCVDVERFKLVNDLYGIERGDHFLRYMADCLRRQICEDGEYAARLGVDVFLIYTERDQEGLDILVKAVRKAFHGYSADMELIPAIGIYHCGEQEDASARLICDRAILAASSVKGDYTREYGVYSSSLMDDLVVVQEILNDTAGAFERGDLRSISSLNAIQRPVGSSAEKPWCAGCILRKGSYCQTRSSLCLKKTG